MDIKNSLDQRRVSLKYLDSKSGDEHSIDVSIDKNLKEFSVSVAGRNPNISVTDPKNETYDKGKEVLNLEYLKVTLPINILLNKLISYICYPRWLTLRIQYLVNGMLKLHPTQHIRYA